MAAKVLDSDLDIAFNLQMQKALPASLALSPTASASTSHLSPRPYDAVLDIAATQEREDHEQTISEVTKAKEDLSHRIDDQKFAADLRHYYKRPYCPDGSGSSSSAETENLRLYCKGLVSEERVRDMNVVVAAVGVAICDPRDNLVFEARKKLEAVVDGAVMSNEAAELEAVVEGLNNALALDLKSVTFYCDDYMLYQYVTNRMQPGNSKVATLVSQVSSLRRKFEYCSPSLVAHSDLKFALKLAREAIVSQITWPAESNNGKSLKETCVICFDDIDVAEMFSIDGCLHRYCFACMKQHVEVKFLNGMKAECPHEGCKTDVNIDSCAKFLAPELVDAISQRIRESAIPVTDKVYCPNARCSALMSKREVLEYTNTHFASAEQWGSRRCMKCQFYFCINCKVPFHFNMNCSDYKRSHPFACPEDQLLKSLATMKLWRQCVKCNHLVELSEGCYHITCRCGYEFCYTCGAEWKNKKATCSCPIWDECNIIREQPQQAQPIIRQHPQQGEPVILEQPLIRQPVIHQQPWQGQPGVHEQDDPEDGGDEEYEEDEDVLEDDILAGEYDGDFEVPEDEHNLFAEDDVDLEVQEDEHNLFAEDDVGLEVPEDEYNLFAEDDVGLEVLEDEHNLFAEDDAGLEVPEDEYNLFAEDDVGLEVPEDEHNWSGEDDGGLEVLDDEHNLFVEDDVGLEVLEDEHNWFGEDVGFEVPEDDGDFYVDEFDGEDEECCYDYYD